jgi:hypothetical protein
MEREVGKQLAIGLASMVAACGGPRPDDPFSSGSAG